MSNALSLPQLSPDEARRVDQTCDRFEAALKANQRTRPEEYLGEAGEPERSALLRQLLILDWDYRRRAADDPHAADYHARFPNDAALIDEVAREMTESPGSTDTGADGLGARRGMDAGGPSRRVRGARSDLSGHSKKGGRRRPVRS